MGRRRIPLDHIWWFTLVTRRQMAPVARAPQDPHPPTKCLFLTEK